MASLLRVVVIATVACQATCALDDAQALVQQAVQLHETQGNIKDDLNKLVHLIADGVVQTVKSKVESDVRTALASDAHMNATNLAATGHSEQHAAKQEGMNGMIADLAGEAKNAFSELTNNIARVEVAKALAARKRKGATPAVMQKPRQAETVAKRAEAVVPAPKNEEEATTVQRHHRLAKPKVTTENVASLLQEAVHQAAGQAGIKEDLKNLVDLVAGGVVKSVRKKVETDVKAALAGEHNKPNVTGATGATNLASSVVEAQEDAQEGGGMFGAVGAMSDIVHIAKNSFSALTNQIARAEVAKALAARQLNAAGAHAQTAKEAPAKASLPERVVAPSEAAKAVSAPKKTISAEIPEEPSVHRHHNVPATSS